MAVDSDRCFLLSKCELDWVTRTQSSAEKWQYGSARTQETGIYPFTSGGSLCPVALRSLRRHFPVSVFIAFLCLAPLAGGQVNPGAPSFSAYDRHEYDTVNLQNLNVTLNVPVISKNGAFPFQFALTGADSYITSSGPGVLNVPLDGITNGSILGNAGALGVGVGLGWTSIVHGTCPGRQSEITYSGLYLVFPDGTIHPLPVSDSVVSSSTCPTSLIANTIDGSGLTATVTGNVSLPTVTALYNSSGMSLSASALKDSNGNSISYNSSTGVYTDTLGVTVLTSSLNTSPVSYTWSDGSTPAPAVDVTNTSYTIALNRSHFLSQARLEVLGQ